MFRNPMRHKTQGAVAAGALALIACGDPTARTDLRPEGDPEVLTVLVLNDSVGGLVEAAAYCAPNDEKRPGLVGLPDFTTTQICPDDLAQGAPMLMDAAPDTWYVRVQFDELLDPNIEDLIEIFDDDGQPTGTFEGSLARTQPVTLKCTGVDGALHDVPYDGYYSPSGNSVTWPLGPSLVIKQTGEFIIPTNSECTIELKDTIVDKQGNQVPAAQRGPFKFKLAGLKPLLVDPSDEGKVDAFQIYFDNIYAQFNAEIQVPSLCTDDGNGLGFFGLPPTFAAVCKSDEPVAFDLQPRPGGFCADTFDPCTMDSECGAGVTCDFFYIYSLFPFGLSRAEFGFGPLSPVETDKMYTFTMKQGTMIKDRCGVVTTLGAPSVAAQTQVSFTTNKFNLNKTTISINNGDVVPANRKMRLPWNNVIDLSTIDPATEISMDPMPMLNATTPLTPAQLINTSNEADLFIPGHYQPNTEYTFTLKAGATVDDVYGAKYTHAADTVIKFKTQPISITASSPANGATVTKATPTSTTFITFSFNQGMDVTTFGADDIEFTGTPTNLSFSVGTLRTTRCNSTSTGCQLRVSGVFTPGEYTIKLKAGAAMKDLLGNDYMQATDRIIKFTVREATPAPVIPCLGS